MAGVEFDSTFVVETCFLVSWAAARLGNFLFADNFPSGLKTILALSVNDANDDWMIYCTECPVELLFLFEPLDEHLTVLNKTGLTIGGFSIIHTPWTITLVLDFAVDIDNIEIVMASENDVTIDAIVNATTYNLTTAVNTGGGGQTHDVDLEQNSDTIVLQADANFYIYQIKITGTY